NHAASRRALARLYRETDRARVELVAPVVIVEDDDAPRPTATVTLPSPAPVASLLETPISGVLQRCDTMPSALGEIVLESETELESPGLAPPPWLTVALCDAPGTAANVVQGESQAPATVSATLRSAVDSELLEIDVQFARDTERPRPGWPREWHADSPALPGVELVPAQRAMAFAWNEPECAPATLAAALEWNDQELEATAPETMPQESHRRTQPGLSAIAWLGEIEVPPHRIGAGEPQTLRVSSPAESGIEARHRSDLGQLLSRFLSDSGSDERITKDLRRSMGLELEAERLSEDERSRAVGG
ncbi:MAG: hypothetical protein ABW217_08955, partial [Polyangiaceae bacterium]